MKKQKFIRFVAFILLILMIVPIVCMTISAKGGSTAGTGASSSGSKEPPNNPDDTPNSKNPQSLLPSFSLPKNIHAPDVHPTYAYSVMNTVNASLIRIMEVSEDPSLENLTEALFDITADVCMLFGPAGQLIGGLINIGQTLSQVDAGVPPRSEIQDLQDTMLLEFDKMNEQLTDIERGLNGLSDEINASTNEIISSLTTHIDNTAAKEYLEEFMLSSGIGDFGYNQFRNYIYGAAQNNASGATAYYALAKQSIRNGASEEEVRYYYDQLYTALMDYREAYKDYLLGTDTGKSVVEYYYDVVSANPELLSGNMTAEEMTVLFAYDLYQTEFMANQILLACNTRYLT